MSTDAHLLRWARTSCARVQNRGRLARWTAYSRLVFSGILAAPLLGVALFLTVGMPLGVLKTFFAWVINFSSRPQDTFSNVALACLAILTFPMFLVTVFVAAWSAFRWIRNYVHAWQHLGPLLRDAAPLPGRMNVTREQVGSASTSRVQIQAIEDGPALPASLERLGTGGVLGPGWLRKPCSNQPVLIYGAKRATGPFLIENTRGQIALVHTDLA